MCIRINIVTNTLKSFLFYTQNSIIIEKNGVVYTVFHLTIPKRKKDA